MSIRRFTICAALVLGSLSSKYSQGDTAASNAGTPAAINPASVSAEDQVAFRQKTVQAQMQELQDRMYRLGEMTREAEPDDSARLLMAVRKAREGLIIEQMKETLDVIARQDLNRATDDQAQVIVKLEELKKLLTTADLDLEMQLQRLRDLNKAIAQLDAAIKDEHRQLDHTTALASSLAKLPTTQPLDVPKQQQQQTRRSTESIAQKLKDLGPAPAKASDTLGTACQSMSMAEGHLGAAQPADAQTQQTQAVTQMTDARNQLEAERQKILDDLERQVRKQVVMNLTEMLDRQKAIRESTQAILPANSLDMAARCKPLTTSETSIVTIGEQTLELIQETDFSVALPPAIKAVDAQCALVVIDLQDGHATAPLVTREQQIEQDLSDLLETFKQLANSKTSKSGQCRGCKGDKNKLLAELRVLRMMQTRVNSRTELADQQRGASSDLSPELKTTIAAASDAQKQVSDATQQIHQQLQ